MAATWSEAVEEFLPLRLSTLFFFDGEKIDQWSNWQAAEQLISDAVHSLLGLDVIDRAIADLEAVERKANAEIAAEVKDPALAALQERFASRQQERDRAEQQLAAASDAVKRAEAKLKELEPKLVARGIPLLDRKAELVALRDAARERLERARSDERQRRTEADRARRERERFGELLRERDSAMLASAPATARKWLEQWLRAQSTEGFRPKTTETAARGADSDGGESRTFTTREQELRAEVERLDGLLARIPTESEAAEILTQRNEALRSLERAAIRRDDLAAAASQHELALTGIKLELDRAVAAAGIHYALRNTSLRHVTTASAALAALRDFKTRVIADLCQIVGARVTSNFAELLHKADLFDIARIGTSERRGTIVFSLVVEKNARELDPDRFSAGERQMFALAIIWALLAHAARIAPIVIDTPLARLDRQHRARLALTFLPGVSPQVVALATDEEFAVLDPLSQSGFVSAVYHLARPAT
jgi:DNA sulfur modification protein DndD